VKILQITNKPAYPSIDGGCLGMAKMSGFYDSNSDYSLDILTIETQKHPFIKSEFDNNLGCNTSVSSVFINTKTTLTGALSNYFGEKSYNLSRFKNIDFETKLLSLISQNKYDIIQFENIFVAQYFKSIRDNSNAKLILNSANVEYEIWERLAQKSSLLKKIYFKKLAKQLKAEEINIWNNMDGIISATDKDKLHIEEKTNTNIPIITIPFYLNCHEYSTDFEEKKTPISFFHIGAMDWMPNVKGVNCFIENVWNTNFKTNKNTFNLAGKSMPEEIKNKTSENLNVKGFVEDAKQFISQNDVMIVPLFSGSGIRVKIIEAMAMGKCIISTSIGAEGINYENNLDILIANTKEDFVEKMNYLIKNTTKINEIGKNARKLAEKEHDISLMKNKLSNFLVEISTK